MSEILEDRLAEAEIALEHATAGLRQVVDNVEDLGGAQEVLAPWISICKCIQAKLAECGRLLNEAQEASNGR
ncbi:MAG: hypothetical protein WD645_01260 [Dehalococcoidia bacterium]